MYIGHSMPVSTDVPQHYYPLDTLVTVLVTKLDHYFWNPVDAKNTSMT